MSQFKAIIIAVSSVILMGITAWVSATDELNYDEAYTYLKYCKSWSGFLTINLANNHPLNSLLVYLFSSFSPYTDWLIRLPNLVFLCVYLYYSAKIAALYRARLSVFFLFSLFTMLIPEFFGQARGYGIASALIMAFIYYQVHLEDSNKKFIHSLYLITMASSAYSGLLPVVILVGTHFLFFSLKGSKLKFLKNNWLHLVVNGLALCYLGIMLLMVSEEGKPLYGETEKSYLEATLAYLVSAYFGVTSSVSLIVAYGIAFSLLGFITYQWIKNKKLDTIPFLTTTSFILIYVLSVVAHKPFITGRLLLPFFPLIAFSIVIISAELFEKVKLSRRFIHGLDIAISIVLIWNYFNEIQPQSKPLFKIAIAQEYDLRFFDHKYSPTKTYYLNQLGYVDDLPSKLQEECKKFNINDGLDAYYYPAISVLIIEADNSVDFSSTFLIESFPFDTSQLHDNQRITGSIQQPFKWIEMGLNNPRYTVLLLPEMDLECFKISQFEQEKTIWKTEVNLN